MDTLHDTLSCSRTLLLTAARNQSNTLGGFRYIVARDDTAYSTGGLALRVSVTSAGAALVIPAAPTSVVCGAPPVRSAECGRTAPDNVPHPLATSASVMPRAEAVMPRMLPVTETRNASPPVG